MAENEMLLLEEKSRIYTAAEPTPANITDEHPPVYRKRRRRRKNPAGKVLLAASAISLIFCSPECRAAGEQAAHYCGQVVELMSIAAARAELMSITRFINEHKYSSFFENMQDETVNTDNDGNASESRFLTLSGDDSGIVSVGLRHMPSSADEESDVTEVIPVPDYSDSPDNPLPYYSCGDGAGGEIIRQTYGRGEGADYIDLKNNGQIRNVTNLSSAQVAAAAELAPDFTVEINSDKPQVLIMHTHTTESYEKTERSVYDTGFLSKTTDSSLNMTAVGSAMAKILNDSGINTIHDATVHDYPSYNGSYDRSRETVKALLEKYPSIKIVLDVHRDAIEKENGTRIAPAVTINGRSAAQVMIICGCDDGTMNMPDCMKNLRTAALFESAIETAYPGLSRPVLFDYRKYNQDLTTGSLLIEVGGHANSLDEAVYAGQLTAKAIAAALRSN